MDDVIDFVIAELIDVILEELMFEFSGEISKEKRLWVREWISRRNELGASILLLEELATDIEMNMRDYHKIMRLPVGKFDELLGWVTPLITKRDTIMRPALTPKIKLEATLVYLASGVHFSMIEAFFRLPKSSVSQFLPEVLAAISNVLTPFLTVPNTSVGWKRIQDEFMVKWQFPFCIGSLDGKHMQIQNPPNMGSSCFNYKGTYSIILLALVDADYCFTYVNIGANGSVNDSSVFTTSDLNTALENGLLNVPNDAIIVADDAFPLRPDIMKPYSGDELTLMKRVFNYRLSRARRLVENVFGILASRFLIFKRPIDLKLTTTDRVVHSACAIHNWLRKTSRTQYTPPNSVDVENPDGTITPGTWRNEVSPLVSVGQLGSNNYSRRAADIRDSLAYYFVNEGAVPWQLERIGFD